MKTEYIEHLKDRFKDCYNNELNLTNPSTFNEQILKFNIEYSDTELDIRRRCADKYLVRNFFKERVGNDIGVPIDNVLTDPFELRSIKFETPHIIKCNHASGFNFVCDGGFVKTNMIKVILACMKIPWYKSAYEMWYCDIERKIITEPLIPNVRDIRAYCVDGVVKLYEVCYIKGHIRYSIGSNGMPTFIQEEKHDPSNRLSYYDTEWNYIPELIRSKFSALPETLDEKPVKLDLIKAYSETLSKGFPFVRVDFIVSNDSVYCEELTFAPGGGFSPFNSNGDELMYQLVFG